MNFFFFGKFWRSWIFLKELKILIDEFFFFHFFWIFFRRNWKFWLMIFFWKQPKKYKPNAPSPKALFENFLLFFFFLKNLEILNFWRNLEFFIEDLFIGDFSFGIWFWRFFLWKIKNFPFEKPILWMRTTLARSWCGLLDKSLAQFLQKDNFN